MLESTIRLASAREEKNELGSNRSNWGDLWRAYDVLDKAERSRFELLIVQFLKAMESAWALQDLGVLTKEQWYGYEVSIRLVVGSPGGRVVLDKYKDAFSQNFYDMVHDVITGSAG